MRKIVLDRSDLINKMNKRISIIIVCLFLSAHLFAQRLFVLWDKINDIPVSRASVYTTCQGKVKSTFSDQQGRVSVDFTFDSLIISHINYRKVCVRTLPDTLFLRQMTRTLPEIVVNFAGEPAWIRPTLKNFVKQKAAKYRNDGVQKYYYETQNIGNAMLYHFASKGLVRKNELFEIHPMESIITFKDQTAGCDYSNLKNTLYHDFVSDMDEKFVKDHIFYIDEQTEGLGDNVAKIQFKSKKQWKDSGFLCIDTVRNVILRAKRSTGLEYNMKNRTNAFVRSTVNVFYGHKYKDWQIDIEVEYQQLGNSYYLSNCQYANYIREEFDSKKRKGENVYSVTSIYKAKPYQEKSIDDKTVYLILPKPFAMKIIMSKKETKQEESLQNIKKDYRIY